MRELKIRSKESIDQLQSKVQELQRLAEEAKSVPSPAPALPSSVEASDADTHDDDDASKMKQQQQQQQQQEEEEEIDVQELRHMAYHNALLAIKLAIDANFDLPEILQRAKDENVPFLHLHQWALRCIDKNSKSMN